MLKNYFKIAWRNLFRNKGFSLTNLLGLTIGITCIILICLWVQDELTYNKFHKKYDNIYQVMAHRNFNNQIFTDPNMVLPLAKTIQAEIPQVKYSVVTTHGNSHVLTYGDKMLKKQGYTVSEHFFDMFTWNFKLGNAGSALQDAYSIVLTESSAKALFGTQDPLNKIIKVDNDYDAKVTAVVADVPGNSTFQFDFINTFNYDNAYLKNAMTNWQNSSWDVFVQTTEGADINSIDRKINGIKVLHDPGDKKISTYFSFPMENWRLYADFKDGKNIGGLIKYVRLFSIIALIVLLIACVNFMNLSTARAEKRAKEVGVRKTLGSGKMQLALQFFFESLILACMAFILSIAAVYLLLPSFNSLVDKHLSLNFAEPLFWLASVPVILITGLIAGSYPALYLSSFNPVKVLKGTFLPGKAAVLPRRILVISQFIISILLISATIIVYMQIQHIKNREMGYDPNNLIMIPASPDTQKNFPVIKQELLQTGYINSVVRTFSPITDIWWKMPSPDWQGKPANLNILFAGMATDVGFTKTMGIKMLDGKDFTGVPSDSGALLLNKAAADAMGFKNPVGTKVRFGGEYTIIGVTDNVIMASPFQPVDPMMVFFDPNNSNYISLRLNSNAHLQDALRSIEKTFKKYNPANPFEYKFVDQEFNRKFLTEELISKLTTIFAGLAIFICCLGLAGLASFTIEKRIREIGIRKVLGASVQSLLMLISKEFLKLVMVAFVIAVPVGWWFMYNWLQNYNYRVHISFWIFGIVGAIILVLTITVVILNTLKAALNNPVKSLRTE
jgi:ABC-type antimicrobial peptide transport system permease subunit